MQLRASEVRQRSEYSKERRSPHTTMCEIDCSPGVLAMKRCTKMPYLAVFRFTVGTGKLIVLSHTSGVRAQSSRTENRHEWRLLASIESA